MALNYLLKPSYLKFKQTGVSLLEFVLGLVLLSIVLLGVTLFFASQKQQLDPVFQFRAVSLAEAVAEQILAVKYDKNNNPFEQKRCGVNDVLSCSNLRDITHNKLSEFEQVDDFQLWCKNGENGAVGAIKGELLAEQLQLPRKELYKKFLVETCVDISHVLEEAPYKEVTINLSIDLGAGISFKLQRYNIR